MPKKDRYGVWREDETRCNIPEGEGGEYLYCPECGEETDIGYDFEGDSIDWELVGAWGIKGYPDDDEIWKFCFYTEITYCDECGWSCETGDDYYVSDPHFKKVNSPRPLTPEAAAIAEAAAETERQIKAGQLRLFA